MWRLALLLAFLEQPLEFQLTMQAGEIDRGLPR